MLAIVESPVVSLEVSPLFMRDDVSHVVVFWSTAT